MKLDWTHVTDDIEEIFEPTPDWDFDLFQLQAGQLGYRVASAVLPGLTLSLEVHDRCVRSFQQKRSSGVYLGALLSVGDGNLWQGRTLRRGQFLNFGADDHDFVLPAQSTRLNIDIAHDLALRTGLDQLPVGLWDAQPQGFDAFIRRCLALIRRDATAHQACDHAADRLIGRLLSCLSQPASGAPNARYVTLKRAEALLADYSWDTARGVDDLCCVLGVSRRTLHRAFDEILGMGPAGYIRLVRLHHFHRILKQNEAAGSVTEAALDAGFEHLGRAARYYKTHFGILPRDVGRLIAAE